MTRAGSTVSGAIANLAAQGLPFVLLLVVTPLLLRSLGPQRYGALVLFNLVPTIAMQLDLGLGTVATRGVAQGLARDERRRTARLLAIVGASLVLWGLVLAVCYWLARDSIGHALGLDVVLGDGLVVFALSAIAIPFSLANTAALAPLRAMERYGTVARVQVAAGLTYWTLCATWASHGATLVQLVGLGSLVVALTTLGLVASVAASGLLRPDAEDPARRGDAAVAFRSFRSGWLRIGSGAFVAQVASLATYHADKLLVSALLSPAAAGAYAICGSIANKTLLIVAASATYTFPRSARLHASGDTHAIAETFVLASRTALVLSTAIALPLVALAPAFLRVWIGPTFAAAYASTMSILALGYAVGAASVVASNVAIGIGETRLPAAFAVLGGVATLILVWLLAPAHGAAGAAAAAAIGMSQAIVFNLVVVERLGHAARRAGLAVLAQLALVAAPIGLVASLVDPFLSGWPAVVVAMGATSVVFVAAWLATFGRHHERALFAMLVTGRRDVRHRH